MKVAKPGGLLRHSNDTNLSNVVLVGKSVLEGAELEDHVGECADLRTRHKERIRVEVVLSAGLGDDLVDDLRRRGTQGDAIAALTESCRRSSPFPESPGRSPNDWHSSERRCRQTLVDR